MKTTSPPLANHKTNSGTPALNLHQDHLDVIDPDIGRESLEGRPPSMESFGVKI